MIIGIMHFCWIIVIAAIWPCIGSLLHLKGEIIVIGIPIGIVLMCVSILLFAKLTKAPSSGDGGDDGWYYL
jgi:hypothetical protein